MQHDLGLALPNDTDPRQEAAKARIIWGIAPRRGQYHADEKSGGAQWTRA
jgi:hypothetical protein